MVTWLLGVFRRGITGGVGGGMAAYEEVSQLNDAVRAHPCPQCGVPLAGNEPGRRTWTQVLWGGWTCPKCACDVDRFGNERDVSH